MVAGSTYDPIIEDKEYFGVSLEVYNCLGSGTLLQKEVISRDELIAAKIPLGVRKGIN